MSKENKQNYVLSLLKCTVRNIIKARNNNVILEKTLFSSNRDNLRVILSSSFCFVNIEGNGEMERKYVLKIKYS